MSSDSLNEFWDWAVARYEDAQVREELLELQETAGIIILEVLFLAWLGHRGQVISQQDQQCIREAITPWVEGVVLPLRRQRHAWTDNPLMATNRGHLLGLELEAERVLANLLIKALAIGDIARGETPAVDENLTFPPELKDPEILERVTQMLGR